MAIQPIQSGNFNNSVSQTKSASKSTRETKDQTVAFVANTDTVSITYSIHNAVDSDSSNPAVNKNRVANIKAALQSGSYVIDPERVAWKMIRFDQALLSDTT